MRILIAGAKGQLGRALVRAAGEHDLIALGHERLDITSAQSVRDAVRSTCAELVVNAAAYNDVDGAEGQIELAHAVNALGPRLLALESAAAGIPLVHVSTDYVFDGSAGQPYHELDAPHPLSEYGRSKLAGELAVTRLNPKHYIVRTAWLFDADGRNFVNTMRACAGQRQVRVVCDQYGSPTYAPDLARGIVRIIENNQFGLYHMAGSGGAASRYELVSYLYSLLGTMTEVVAVSHREFKTAAVRPAFSALTSIRQSPMVLPSWQEGVRAYCEAVASEPAAYPARSSSKVALTK
jgi:dTDP-4-dehydrorhamnose reductase